MGGGQGMLQANDRGSCACAGSRSPHWGFSALVAHFVACREMPASLPLVLPQTHCS